MKANLLLLLFLIPLVSRAAEGNEIPSSNNNESSKISLYIPGFIMKAGSFLVSKEKNPEAKNTLSKMRSISLVIRDGASYHDYKTSKKYDKKLKGMKCKNFESIVEVADHDTKASVFMHQNKKAKVRQVVVIADDGDESFVFARLRCNFNMDDVKNLLRDKTVISKFKNVAED